MVSFDHHCSENCSDHVNNSINSATTRHGIAAALNPIHLPAIHAQSPIVVEEQAIEAQEAALSYRFAVKELRVRVNVDDDGAWVLEQGGLTWLNGDAHADWWSGLFALRNSHKHSIRKSVNGPRHRRKNISVEAC